MPRFGGNSLYNGFPHDSMTSRKGAAHLGVEHIGALAGRGVFRDDATYLGVHELGAEHVITETELQKCAEAQESELRPGDLVLVRTGWLEGFRKNTQSLCLQLGIGRAAAQWLVSHDVALIGSDKLGRRGNAFEGDDFLAVHIECLVRRAIYLLEHVELAALAADKFYELVLVVPPLNITGATCSPMNAIG